MLESVALDVVIGLVLLYFLLAVLVSTVNEFLAAFADSRAKNLEVARKSHTPDRRKCLVILGTSCRLAWRLVSSPGRRLTRPYGRTRMRTPRFFNVPSSA
jgi:hypothetical protein